MKYFITLQGEIERVVEIEASNVGVAIERAKKQVRKEFPGIKSLKSTGFEKEQ